MKIDRIPARARVSFLSGVSAACAAALLSGCMSSPTYGTGKTANVQLLEDITGVISTGTLTGESERRAAIAYTPRAELVRPASMEVLPEPQRELASAENPAWPESPEQRRARIRSEATENQENGLYRPAIRGSGSSDVDIVSAAAAMSRRDGMFGAQDDALQRSEFQRRARQSRQGDAASRRYLSEPPVDYRVPSATAPSGELGEDEWKKQQDAKRASGKSSWRDYIPRL